MKWFIIIINLQSLAFLSHDVIYPGESSMFTAKNNWNILFFNEMPWICQLGSTGQVYHLKLCFHINFLTGRSVHWCDYGFKVAH